MMFKLFKDKAPVSENKFNTQPTLDGVWYCWEKFPGSDYRNALAGYLGKIICEQKGIECDSRVCFRGNSSCLIAIKIDDVTMRDQVCQALKDSLGDGNDSVKLIDDRIEIYIPDPFSNCISPNQVARFEANLAGQYALSVPTSR